jgi:putative transposase
MSQSLSNAILHLAFSTKERKRWIDREIEPRLHAYMATLCKTEGCHVHRIGEIEDHVHIVTTLPRTITIAKLFEIIKSRSLGWIKRQSEKYHDFYWQTGGASFSVSPKDLDAVVRYVSDQHGHHQRTSFQDEMRKFFAKYGVQFDERYVWD